MNDERLPAVEPEQDPEVVEEAHHALRRLRIIGAVSFVAVLVLLAAILSVLGFPYFFLLPVGVWAVLAFAAYEVFPLGRDASWARRVLKRWDEVRVDRAFDQIGAASDPRLEAAGAMAARIGANPAADRHTKSVVELVIRRLRSALDDLRLLELADKSAGPERKHRPDPELRTQLEARIAGLTGALADVYSASLARDDTRVRELVEHLEDVARRLEAEVEVQAFLDQGPKE